MTAESNLNPRIAEKALRFLKNNNILLYYEIKTYGSVSS